MEGEWPEALPFALFITHRLFLDFGSLLYPLAGRQAGRQAGRKAGRKAGVVTGQGQQIQEHKEQEEDIKKVNKSG